MQKKEIVYRTIACDFIKGKNGFTQLELSRRLGISLSTVNLAARSLSGVNAIVISRRSFKVSSLDRLLFYWASHRNLDRDVIYETRVEAPIRNIEGEMPDCIAFTAYAAYRLLYNDAPADYSETYVYAGDDALKEIKNRFKARAGAPNLFVLAADPYMAKQINARALRKSSVCPAQAFVDLWNIRTWYAKEFADELLKRLGI